MLRDLSAVIEELHASVVGVTAQALRAGLGIRVTDVDMTLPIDLAPVFKDGGCALLADVARSHADHAWLEARSRLRVVWQAVPTGYFGDAA